MEHWKTMFGCVFEQISFYINQICSVLDEVAINERLVMYIELFVTG